MEFRDSQRSIIVYKIVESHFLALDLVTFHFMPRGDV